MIALAVITVGFVCAVLLAVLVLGALARDLLANRRRRIERASEHTTSSTWQWDAHEADNAWRDRQAA